MVTPPSLIPQEYGNRVKTDRRDSRKLAYFLAKGLLKRVWVPSEEERYHRQVIRRRRQLVGDRVRVQNRIIILYDAFGNSSSLKKDWGFSALVEYGGKRILFDTGNNADIFTQNIKALSVDLSKLDFVVISHRHGDHTSGLNYLLSANPHVRIYAPKEIAGVFGSSLPGTFYRRE